MKVLHIVGNSAFGGIARIIVGLGQVARSEGWEVDVLATNADVQKALRKEGLGVVNIDVIRREIRPSADLADLLRLRAFLRRESYGIVHTHTSKGGFLGRLAARLAGVPVIIHTVHGFAFHEASPPAARVFYSILERAAASWCDRIVSVSEFHRRWALDLRICEQAKILAIPNGIAEIQLDPSFGRAGLRRELGVEDADLLVLSTSRLAADKGVADLIAATALLRHKERRFRIVIAGDGPMRNQLEQEARNLGIPDLVTFLGFREDIGSLLAACDLVALPSLREGMSIAMLEAMAAGKPIVATSIGSNRELACQAEMARLVPPANPRALAEAIQTLGRDAALMASLAAEGRRLFERRYTEERMLDSYRVLYRELLELNVPGHVTTIRRERPQALQARRAAVGGEPGDEVRKADLDDLPGIVSIHQQAFGHFFLSQLGSAFLRRYYRLVLNYPRGIVMVSGPAGSLHGFVCGFLDPAEFYRLMWRHKRVFVFPALSALIRHPSLASGILGGIRRVQTSALRGRTRSCELSSIAVAPYASGSGLGRKLVQAFLAESWSMDAQRVYLTTDARNNERPNELYRDAGFERARLFLQRKGRWMNEYAINRP